ncbi:MAG: rod shape-determining protein MreB [Planctomycetota bacterium]|jgi:rod shape-determining protein MreB
MPSFFNSLLGLFSLDMGVDLGTANTLVCVGGQGIVLHEPSVVAVKKGTNQVLLNGDAVGNTAKVMLGKTPYGITAIRPLKDGVIADFEITEAMLSYFIRKVHNRRRLVKPRVVIGVPSGITQVEKRAVINSAERAGAREVFLIEEPMAAGIGVGLPIEQPVGSMIVDIGGGTTDVAVMSLAGIVEAMSMRVAGDEMDEAIMQYVKEEYNLLIGPQSAEEIKHKIGSAVPLETENQMEVRGRDGASGLPRKIIMTSEEVRKSLSGPVGQLQKAIRHVLERTPPELSADLVHQGIVLAGGGALLRGLDRAIEQEVELPTRVADEPLLAVAKGTTKVLERLDLLSQILESGSE